MDIIEIKPKNLSERNFSYLNYQYRKEYYFFGLNPCNYQTK